jgi:hypothetical protein
MKARRFRVLLRTASLGLLLALAVAAGPQSASKSPKQAAQVARPAPAPQQVGSNRHYITVRGEIVDYYCYIEKGLTGPGHKACGTRCVAGDICMGILTTDGALYMISVNHFRAMDPLGMRSVPDPFETCRGWIAEKVDLSGYAMERKGQRIIEIMEEDGILGPSLGARPREIRVKRSPFQEDQPQ